MKKLTIGIIILTLLISCKQDKNTKHKSLIDKTNTAAYFNQFNGKYKAQAMVLGVFHFDNPGLDSYKSKFSFNILEENRQAELDILLEKIMEYKPTKILLEWSRIKQDSITNEQYQSYLNGDFKIDERKNEVYQIGFKLAKRLGHKRVYCSDASSDWFGIQLDWENYDQDTYLKSRGQYKKSTRYDYEPYYKFKDSIKTIQTLTKHLSQLNSPEYSLKSHQAYLTNDILQGAGDNYLGADVVASWYRRNIRIFSNAYDFTDFNKQERLLLIYGSGHVWQLRQFFQDSPDFEYVEINRFL